MNNFDDQAKELTEKYWRNTIANEIYESCPSTKNGGYPCEECHDFYEFVLYKIDTAHDR